MPDRRYEKCRPCKLPEYATDAPLGLEEDYTVGFLFLAVRAGSRGSYHDAQEDMKVWRGLEVSHETIRMLCHKEAPKIKQFVEKSAEVPKDFIAANGNVEITIDATKVNTLGSGQVEGACKSMIGRRLKQTGARWNVDRLNEMAVLCSVHYSDLWQKYWSQAK